jgi:hypothetical protein
MLLASLRFDLDALQKIFWSLSPNYTPAKVAVNLIAGLIAYCRQPKKPTVSSKPVGSLSSLYPRKNLECQR